MRGTIAVVVGAKGGVGATTLCVELIRIMRESKACGLVDADFSGRRCVAVLTDSVRSFDGGRIGGNLSSATILNDVAGIEFTASIDGAFTLMPDMVAGILGDVRDTTEFVLVDAPQPYAAAVRPFVVNAAHFIVVVEPTLLGVTSARAVQTELARFGIPASRVYLVLNQRDARAAVRPDEVERALGSRLLGNIPPIGDRRYQKAVEGLAAALIGLPLPAEIDPLKPSAKTPLGDRRASNRRPKGDAKLEDMASGAATEAHIVATMERTARDLLKTEIHDALSQRLDVVAASAALDEPKKIAELRSQIDTIVREILATYPAVFSAEELARVRQEIIDEALGYGPLEELLAQNDVTEIMVNGPNHVFVERNGKIESTNKRFSDDRQLRVVIERMIAPLGRRIDESVPMVDARLPDGSRLNAIIEPLALDGPTLTIRRFGKNRLTPDDLVNFGAIDAAMLDFLRAAVEARMNLVICGGTGSGKTTFLNILSSFIPEGERIVTIEDAAELRLNQSHIVRLEGRPANLQGAGEVRIRDLVRNALRMRPDRIIVGECRGAEALDMLQAMNTGHDGSLTTIHANSARDAISRIETMVMMAGFELPIKAIRDQVASAIDIIVHISRMRDGSRKVVGISEIAGLEGDVVTMQEIVRYRQRGLDKNNKVVGEFEYTGAQPECLAKFAEFGVSFDVRSLGDMAGAPVLGKAASW
ncbi:MAG: pilus assembly protein CpaE cpaF, tadA [Candidatus Eremiobacteraeota bacterium]|nr:pilus assembly protein CpaE cpaF, tadA [Candidatus Eremiobacteraeota bacterium]